MEDYNAAYNVACEGKLITTGAAKELGIPLGEIWISKLWKLYEKFIVFHELREVHYRSEGFGRDEAHEKASQEGILLWKDDSLFQKMIKDIEKMDRKTAEKESRQGLG
jgi:competence protein ComEA